MLFICCLFAVYLEQVVSGGDQDDTVGVLQHAPMLVERIAEAVSERMEPPPSPLPPAVEKGFSAVAAFTQVCCLWLFIYCLVAV